MKINYLLTVLAKLMLLSAVGFSLISCKDEHAVIGQSAPDIAAFDLQGNKVSLADWKGKTIILNFWSETCGICITELKTLEHFMQNYPHNNLHIIAMNIDGEKADTQTIVTKREIQLSVVKDQLKISAERYQLVGTPTSFVIDPEGKILYKFEGLIPDQDLHLLFKG
ncbi:TlpA family protein disulfide reductase [Pasteurella oralis]|uniref:TlpA family protein disulfide reductase n=1 Tax=Pasteurella oralis TaxID=1071947 RepID=A0ABW4NUD6_9PAST